MQVRSSESWFLAVTPSLSPTASPPEFVYPCADSSTSLENVAAAPFRYDMKRTAIFSAYKIEEIKRLVPRIQCFYWSQITGQFPHYSPPLPFWLCCRTIQAAFHKKPFNCCGFNFTHKYLNPCCTGVARIAASSHCSVWNEVLCTFFSSWALVQQ